jgi:hypothetical protein
MPPPNRQNKAPAASSQLQWPVALVTGLVGTLAVWLASPQIFPGPQQANEMTLPNLARRAAQLRQITDPVERDKFCVPLSAYGRALDRALAPDARVFLSGMLGKDNGPKLGYYFFLRNYLFPREVAISLDRKAIFHEGWFEGVPCESPTELQTNGFDLLLLMPTNSNNIQIIPLTQKGVPK